MDIPLTRDFITRMDGWLNRIVKQDGLPQARREGGDIVYRFDEQTSRVVEVAKAVRIVSGLNACLVLADKGYIAEVATLLRTLGDFADEIVFLFESSGRAEGPTTEQRKFVEDFFAPVPKTIEDMELIERRRWLSRDEIRKAHGRLAEKTPGIDKKTVRDRALFIELLLNAYAHGGYAESMDLFNGVAQRFETGGISDADHERASKQYLCQKAYYCGLALAFMAMERELGDQFTEILDALDRLAAAPEYRGD